MSWRSHPIVIVPGMRGHVPEHWQTHLAAEHPHARVVDSSTRDKRDLQGRIADLDEVVGSLDTPVTLVAHSAGVLVAAHWALRGGAGIRGAVLATPPDLSRPLPEIYPSLAELETAGWLPIPHQTLPFPSIVGVSSNDDLGEPALVRELAASWGSRLADLGAVGHLNPAAGFGPWAGAADLLDQLDAVVAAT